MRALFFSLMLLASLGATLARADDKAEPPPKNSFVQNACTEKELWKFSVRIPPAWQKKFALPPLDKNAAIELYSWAFALKKNGKELEAQAMGEYWMARSLYQLGLIHLSADSFSALIGKPLSADIFGIKMASLQCLNRLQRTHAAVEIKPEGLEGLKALGGKPLQPWEQQEYWEQVTRIARRKLGLASLGRSEPLSWELQALAGSGIYESFLRVLMASDASQDPEVIQHAEKFLSLLMPPAQLPQSLKGQDDVVRMMLARAHYNAGRFDAAARRFKQVQHSSNYFAQTLTDLAWTHLMRRQYPDSGSVAYNLLVGGPLKNTFTPEAPIIIAIAQYETCHFPESLQTVRWFRKAYEKSYKWLYNWKVGKGVEYQNPYQAVVGYLKKRQKIPDRLATEWLRSPVFISNQGELNLVLDERALSKKLDVELARTAAKLKDKTRKQAYGALREQLVALGAKMPSYESRLTSEINADLNARNQRMLDLLLEVSENSQLVEVEIFNAAGEDIIIENIGRGEEKRIAQRAKEKTKDEGPTLDWGRFPSSAEEGEEAEIWEDELGFLKTDLSNICPK